MRSQRILTVVALALALHAAPFQAQQPELHRPQQPDASKTKSDISVEAKLVVVPASVRDKKNALVGSLKKEDFALQVDGKVQTIRYFDHDSDVPLTLGLLVDTSMSQRTVLDDERAASAKFLETMLAPNRDKAFIIQFARQVELLQDVTDSKPKLQAALKELDTSSPSFASSTSGDDNDSRDRSSRGGTALYDSVFLASDEVTAKQKGRRALILLTDGVDRNSKESLTNSIESAQRADTIIYAIYYKGKEPQHDGGGYPGGRHGGGFPGGGGGYPGGGYPGGGGGRGGGYPRGGGGGNSIDGKKTLERMCGETGGRVFEVKGKETVDAIYGQIAEELRAQYRLGFTPSTEAASDGYHQIVLTLAGKEAKDKSTVQTRDGYYTGAAK
jgi:VWFA-related protein